MIIRLYAYNGALMGQWDSSQPIPDMGYLKDYDCPRPYMLEMIRYIPLPDGDLQEQIRIAMNETGTPKNRQRWWRWK